MTNRTIASGRDRSRPDSRIRVWRRAGALSVVASAIGVAVGMMLDANAAIPAAVADFGAFRHATGQHAQLA